MGPRKRRRFNKYNHIPCRVCRSKTLVALKSGIIRCYTCGNEEKS